MSLQENSSSIYRKKETEKVEAFLFNGELIKDNEWKVPDWIISFFKSGALYYNSRGYGLVADHSNCRNHIDDTLEYPENLILHEAWVKTDLGKGRVESDMRVHPIYIVKFSDDDKVFFYSKVDFESKYDKVETDITLERVDILPDRYREKYPYLKGVWIYIPAEVRSPYYTIRCSVCKTGFQIKNQAGNEFSRVIAPRHYCSNCGAEMQNSYLEEGNHVRRY